MTRCNRRTLISAGGSALALAGLSASFALVPARGRAQEAVQVADLLKPSALGDRTLGDANAAVSVVEYASMSCPHCATFHKGAWKPFKEKYVDTGQVYFVFREFPLNAPAYAVAMLARCAPADRYFTIVDLFFERQDEWLRSSDMFNAILDLAKQVGFTKKTFEACLKNQALFDGLNAEKDRASKSFGVDSTPTFFINGKKQSGALTLEQLDSHIQPLL